MKKKFILPKKITLPCGFVIRVVVGPMTDDGDAEFDYDSGGCGVIRMKEGMTQKQQMYHLSHELLHAVVDYHHLMIWEGAIP